MLLRSNRQSIVQLFQACIERMLNLTDHLRRLRVDKYEYIAMKVIVLLQSGKCGNFETKIHVNHRIENIKRNDQQLQTHLICGNRKKSVPVKRKLYKLFNSTRYLTTQNRHRNLANYYYAFRNCNELVR